MADQMPQIARLLARDLTRLHSTAADTSQRIEATRRQLANIHAATEIRFGMEVPYDGLLLDVLSQIEVTIDYDDDGAQSDPRRWRWMWQGRTRHGTACVRLPNNYETSVPHYLAKTFALIPANSRKPLRPRRGRPRLDVNPWMRTFDGRWLLAMLDNQRERTDGQRTEV